MKRYLVGGAVRDALLGLGVHERDWVVVGADPDTLLAQGYRPVGADFPVFLHPETQEEHALARTERKSGHGYHTASRFTPVPTSRSRTICCGETSPSTPSPRTSMVA